MNLVQKNFPLGPTPFLEMAQQLGIEEAQMLSKVTEFLERGILTRVGPFFNMDKSSGHVTLVAMIVPESQFEEVASIVNSYEEVAHNYRRVHQFNMWFVLATKSVDCAKELLAQIEKRTQLKVYDFPKEREFALDLFLEVH